MLLRLVSARAAVASLLLSTVFLAACGSSSSPSPPPAPTAASVSPASGTVAGGTAVVLTGTSFVTGATVSLGGTAATGVSVNSATSIAFTTPQHAAGAVDVVVRNPDGQSATLAGGFTYVAPTNQAWVVPDDAATLTTTAGGQVEAFTAGNLYVNAHTAANPGGELRGQLDNEGSTIRLASLNAAQESATITSTAFGAGILQVDTSSPDPLIKGKVRGFVITSGLVNITNAHVHRAARTTPPTPGGVVISLVPAGENKDMWVVPDNAPLLTQTLIDAFLAGELYYNVHTAANTGGEIRGQLDKAGTIRLATLNGPQEAGSTSTALGAGLLSVDEATGAVAGFAITTPFSAAVTNAHVHGPAGRGTNASPVVGMTFGPTLVVVPDGAAPLTTGATSQTADFLAGRYYFNVHTATFAGGEIRGQLDRNGDVRVAAMDGAQETPTALTTTAAGAGLVAVDTGSGKVSGFIVTRGLVSPTIAHIHQAARGTGGAPIVGLARQP